MEAYLVEPVVLWTRAVEGDSEGAAEAAETGAEAVEHCGAYSNQHLQQRGNLV